MKIKVQGEEKGKYNQSDNFWNYAVCFGTIIAFIAGIGHVNSFGLIYKDFIVNTNSTVKSLTTAHGVFSVMLSIGGIILNIISKSISLRLGGLIGAVTFTMGSFATIFISNVYQLPFTFGIFQGIGFGMMVPVSYSAINHYFKKKRTTVMSIIKAVQGVALIWYPQLIKYFMHQFGFRGTLLIISAISLHTFPGMIVMRMDEPKSRVRKTITDDIENGRNKHENSELLQEKANGTINNIVIENSSNVQKFKTRFLEILNLNVLRDPVYRNICLGQSFVNFSDLTFFILQPMLLFQYGFDTSEVATCISISAGADVAGRCVLAVISNFANINTRILFYTASLLTFVFRLLILQIREFLYVAMATGMLGLVRAWLHVSSPLVISNHVSHDEFPGAYAVFMLAAGIVNVTCSPVIGLLKDIYEDYIPTFYALTICCVPCLVTWPLELVYRNRLSS